VLWITKIFPFLGFQQHGPNSPGHVAIQHGPPQHGPQTYIAAPPMTTQGQIIGHVQPHQVQRVTQSPMKGMPGKYTYRGGPKIFFSP